LGGDATIRCCTHCNNCKFGSRFEGEVSKDLAPIFVYLSFSGLQPRKTVVHKKAWVDSETGYEYNIDSNRQSTITHPQLIKDADGKVSRIVARSMEEANKLGQSLVKKGKAKQFAVRSETITLQPPLKNIRIKLGTEMRQPAVKMCVGLAQRLVPAEEVIDPPSRKFLLEEAPERSPVRYFFHRYAALDALRPALAHTIYVEGEPTIGRCYSVIQLFGVFQFYVPLHTAYVGSAFAALGVLNVTEGGEQFSLCKPLRLQEAPLHPSLQEYEIGLAQCGDELNNQIRQAFGEASITFQANDKQTLQGVGFHIPVLWIEYAAAVQLELELVPDRTNDKAVSIPNDARQWAFSPDFGRTRLRVFETFVEKWNSQAVDRSLGVDHVYFPEEVQPGVRLLFGEDYWCPVHSFRLHYQVLRQAWLGRVDLANCAAILNRVQDTLEAKIVLSSQDMPMARNPSWPPVTDIDAIQNSTECLITAEQWIIDPNGLIFSLSPTVS
jgi:hypothetical protein